MIKRTLLALSLFTSTLALAGNVNVVESINEMDHSIKLHASSSKTLTLGSVNVSVMIGDKTEVPNSVLTANLHKMFNGNWNTVSDGRIIGAYGEVVYYKIVNADLSKEQFIKVQKYFAKTKKQNTKIGYQLVDIKYKPLLERVNVFKKSINKELFAVINSTKYKKYKKETIKFSPVKLNGEVLTQSLLDKYSDFQYDNNIKVTIDIDAMLFESKKTPKYRNRNS